MSNDASNDVSNDVSNDTSNGTSNDKSAENQANATHAASTASVTGNNSEAASVFGIKTGITAAAKASKSDKINQCMQGRILALQMLYALEQKQYEDDQELVLDNHNATHSAAVTKKAKELLAGFCAQRDAVDASVDKCLQNWTLARLAIMDRALLRLGAYELLYCTAVPPRVVINEYIDLAKEYGSEDRTAKLVNGVLDNIAREHRPNEVKPKKG